MLFSYNRATYSWKKIQITYDVSPQRKHLTFLFSMSTAIAMMCRHQQLINVCYKFKLKKTTHDICKSVILTLILLQLVSCVRVETRNRERENEKT